MDSHSTPDMEIGPQSSEGPLPGSKRMTPEEYRRALTLFLELQLGTQPAGIEVVHDAGLPGWMFLKLAHATKSDHHIIVALSLSDDPWGTAVSSAFYWLTADEAQT